MSYTVDKGVIRSERGIPETPRWFSDSRLSFELNEYGVTRVDYFSPVQRAGNRTLFLERLFHGFRVYVEQEMRNYRPAFGVASLWPFGVDGEWAFQGTVLRLRIMAVAERIVFQLLTPHDLPPGLKWKLEFHRDFALAPADSQDPRYAGRDVVREWDEWTFSGRDNALFGGFAERTGAGMEQGDAESRQSVGVTADFPLEFGQTPINVKFRLTSRETLLPDRSYSFVVGFASSKEAFISGWNASGARPDEEIASQFARYRRVAAELPVLDSPYAELNDYFSLLPMFHESCKVTDVPGAIKAKTSDYWVWGWDGLTSNHATLYWGDSDFIADMLRFYEETADPRRGIAHAYRHDMTVIEVSELPSQGMYISLLVQYFAMTGDTETVRRSYPFARTIFGRIAELEVGGTGMCEGTSLYPDFRNLMGETGHDISSLNNTFFYCAARAMEYLAASLGDRETERRAADICRRFENHFLPLVFDEEVGYPVSSVDALTMERRPLFHSTAIKWDNNYMRELLDGVHERCLDFYERHIVSPAGLRPIPLWCGAFDQDANQPHSWWPVSGEYYMRLINGQNRRDLIEQWVGWVSYWARKLTCPEGIPLYAETAEPELDRWNGLKGTWQAYSMRGWYQAIVHGLVGVDAEAGGLHLYPYEGAEMTLRGLHYRGRRLTIEMRGSGRYVESVAVGGLTVIGTNKLPADLLEGEGDLTITVRRVTENPHRRFIMHGYGCELKNYRFGADGIQAELRGAGTVRLKLGAAERPVVRLGGAEMPVRYDASKREAAVEIGCEPGIAQEIWIR